MKYHAPYGSIDPNASFMNGDPSVGRRGSIPDAGTFEYPQREITNFINSSEMLPSDSDLQQLSKAARAQRVNFAEDIGTVNAIVASFDPQVTNYSLGLPLRVRIAITNTGSTTFDGGAGVKNVKRGDGSNLTAGDLPAGRIAEFIYDGTNFQLSYVSGGVGGANNYSINIPFAVDTGTPNHIIAVFNPAITSLTDGEPFLVRLMNAPTGATDLKVNALTAYTVKTRDGSDIRAGLVSLEEDLLFIWDSGNSVFRLIGVSGATQTARFSGIQPYYVAGNYTWTVPAGVYQIYYELWGAGGGGGSGIGLAVAAPGGGGGYVAGYLAVTPGSVLPILIGAGGSAVGAGVVAQGGVGGMSSFAGAATAYGGGGGREANGWNAAQGGLGGGAVGGMIALTGQTGQSSNTPSVNSAYPVGGHGARMGGGDNNGRMPLQPAAGGSSGNSYWPSTVGADGALFIHY